MIPRPTSRSPEVAALLPTDTRVIRIAKALAEGCDGRSYSSPDAKWLHRRYEQWKDREPSASFTDYRDLAFADFIAGVLNGTIPEPAVTT